MTGRMQQPVCILTGAAGTLGSAFCRSFAHVYQIAAVWNMRRPTAPTQNQHLFDPLDPERQLRINTNPVFSVRADLREDADVTRVVDQVLEHFGRIDVLLNVAVAGQWASLLDGHSTVENAADAFRVNVAAPLALTSLVAREVWSHDPDSNRRANRAVLNLSSTAGDHVFEGYGQGLYSATKAALNMLSRHLSVELRALGVRVNALAPDSFPSRVATGDVLRQMQLMIDGTMDGRIIELQAGRMDKVV